MVTRLHDNYNILDPRRQPNGDVVMGFEDKDDKSIDLFTMNVDAAMKLAERIKGAATGLQVATPADMPGGNDGQGSS